VFLLWRARRRYAALAPIRQTHGVVRRASDLATNLRPIGSDVGGGEWYTAYMRLGCLFSLKSRRRHRPGANPSLPRHSMPLRWHCSSGNIGSTALASAEAQLAFHSRSPVALQPPQGAVCALSLLVYSSPAEAGARSGLSAVACLS
jgi:hypothetical protein